MENSGKQSVHSSFMALFTRTYGLCWVSGEMHLCCITGSKVEGLVLLHEAILSAGVRGVLLLIPGNLEVFFF